ncbi:T9SS type A sorting domain-containing protein [Marixanthomonas ophiurae]|uniref:T9SS C-terminal target domain-containing protein n=1 Tax=Marixanthomonas ophiurae TaxID=387659 RepID=A0A3E1Q7L2_9FLAO|nr:T9SS type A sorting domain-containing protein [Marixanthomonas ophiurae]RFN58108.1 T9SS C-terminal target domain-containing protein [Marixanthomonas ophiurae]
MKKITKTVLLLQVLLVSSMVSAQEYFGTTTFGDMSIENSFHSAVDSNGNIYTPGLYSGSITLGPNTINWAGGNADGYLAIHDSDGNPTGVLGFGGGFDDVVIDVAIDADDNIYLTGYFQGANPNNPFDADPGPDVFPLLQPANGLSRDLFVIKLDSNKEFVWAKQISNPAGFGPINEDAQTIALDSNGDIYIGGSFLYADFDPDPNNDVTLFSADSQTPDGFLLKLDSDGNYQWVKTHEGAGGIVEVESIEFDANEDLFVLGRFRNQVDLDTGTDVDNYISNGTDDAFITKVDIDGNYIWGQTFGGTGLEIPATIKVLQSGIYATGMFSGTVDLDPTAGENNVTSNGDFDAFFSKFDTDGNYDYSYVTGGEGNENLENIFDIIEGPTGSLFISGNFIGTSDFDSSSGEAIVTSNGNSDNFLVELSTSGVYRNHWTIGGSSAESNQQVLFNDNDQIIAIGAFQDSVDLNPFSGEDVQTSNGNRDIYVSRYSTINTGNDSCENAVAVSCGDVVNGETVSDSDSGGNAAPDEFYTYTGNGTLEEVTISLCNNTDFNSVLRVYEDCTLTNEIAMNDDSCGEQSEVSFVSDGISTYYIMVEGFESEAGNFSLEVSCEELPENDICSGALPISCGESITGSTDDATIDVDAPVCNTDITAPGLWYTFTDDSGLVTDYTVSLCDSDYDTKVTVYTGDCGNLICETDNDDSCGLQSEANFQGDGNTTYYILVHGFGTNTGNFTLTVDCTPVPPANDMISNSIDVDEIGFPYSDAAVPMPAATTEGGNPTGCNLQGANGVWYNFVSNGDGEATASIVDPAGTSVVTFFEAPNENASETDLTLVNQGTNQCSPATSSSITTTAGQAYYIFVVNTGGTTDIEIDGTLLSTSENTIEGFTYFPNPTTGVVNLNATETIERATVYNLLGQKVIDQSIENTKSELSISSLSAGTYILKVVVNGETGTYKIIKQ